MKSLKLIMNLLFYLSILFIPLILSTSPPIIEADFDGWNNMTINGQTLVYSKEGGDFALHCRAPYPIRFSIKGFVKYMDIVRIYQVKSGQQFLLTLVLKFPELTLTSAHISCEKIDNPEVNDGLSVFISGNGIYTLGFSREKTTDLKRVACFTTDPSTPTLLYRKVQNGSQVINELVQDVKFNPTKGFFSSSDFDPSEQFICQQGKPENTIDIEASSRDVFEYGSFEKGQYYIREWFDHPLILECKSDKPINIKVTVNPREIGFIKSGNETFKSANITTIPGYSGGFVGGNAVCYQEENGSEKILKRWEFSLVAPPLIFEHSDSTNLKLGVDNTKRKIFCAWLAPYNGFLESIECRNSAECQLISGSNVWRLSASVRDPNRKAYSENVHGSSWNGQFFVGRSVPAFKGGLARCFYTNIDGDHDYFFDIHRTWEYFQGLDSNIYTNWQDAPTPALLSIEKMDRILYANVSNEFICIGLSYLFAGYIDMELEFRNGSRFKFDYNEGTFNFSSPFNFIPRRKRDHVHMISVLNIELPIDSVAVHCVANWWNSSDVIKYSSRFQTRYLRSPTIPNKKEVIQETFYLNTTNSKLTCLASGEPQVDYHWLFNDTDRNEYRNISQVFPELFSSITPDGEGFLQFPIVESKYSGEYKCIAKNKVGETSQRIILNILEKKPQMWLSRDTKILISGVTVFSAALFIALAIAVVILTRKYREEREKRRSLTSGEVQEFFEGKPELVSNAKRIESMDVIDFLPYNSEYEISKRDIIFQGDHSEKNYLGSGQFSYVVKAQISSRNGDIAAVKISKPTADIDLFKSLLSEVKIMIYVGEHENIISLVGVCTEDIREKTIYIVTSVCDEGSLESFLQKSRPYFVDLINDNQIIDKQLAKSLDKSVISTLDLIRFSTQIATGMEYLAFKKIIHSDLAARNVLVSIDRVAKISDFGLSRKLYSDNCYVKKTKCPLPWRWMAPESLATLTFSTESDIWSYGVTLYEIFTLGDKPFPNEEWSPGFIERLNTGMKLGRPAFATPEIYLKLVNCWEAQPEKRSTFLNIRTEFQEMQDRYYSRDYQNAE